MIYSLALCSFKTLPSPLLDDDDDDDDSLLFEELLLLPIFFVEIESLKESESEFCF